MPQDLAELQHVGTENCQEDPVWIVPQPADTGRNPVMVDTNDKSKDRRDKPAKGRASSGSISRAHDQNPCNCSTFRECDDLQRSRRASTSGVLQDLPATFDIVPFGSRFNQLSNKQEGQSVTQDVE